MFASKKTIASVALTSVLAMAYPGNMQAEDLLPDEKTIKQLHTASFDVGRKHVLSYFRKKMMCAM